MRITKESEERKNEILYTAEKLFKTKGYEGTTINDILKEIGIAKGTFYYYFKSKEEVLDAIVMRHITRRLESSERIVNSTDMDAVQKMAGILFANKPQNEEEIVTIAQMHTSENALFHQKAIQKTIHYLTPVFTKVVEQGIQEKVFSSPFPKETIEILLMAQFIFDEGLFDWKQEELIEKVTAYIYGMELLLGTPKDTFSFIFDLFSNPQ